MSDRWMDTGEAADYARFAVNTLERYRIHGGGPPFAKRGRKVLYRLSDVDAWITERVVGSTSELGAEA